MKNFYYYLYVDHAHSVALERACQYQHRDITTNTFYHNTLALASTKPLCVLTIYHYTFWTFCTIATPQKNFLKCGKPVQKMCVFTFKNRKIHCYQGYFSTKSTFFNVQNFFALYMALDKSPHTIYCAFCKNVQFIKFGKKRKKPCISRLFLGQFI